MTSRCLLVAFIVVLPAHLVRAQSSDAASPPRLSVLGATGVARSNHDGSQGYFGLIGLEARTPSPFLRLRVEGLFASMAGGQTVPAVAVTTVLSPLKGATTPYLLATAAVVDSAGPKRAWSFGLGLQSVIRKRLMFVEARMYCFSDPARVVPYDDAWSYFNVPISFGIRF
jgi:hypothetical protein